MGPRQGHGQEEGHTYIGTVTRIGGVMDRDKDRESDRGRAEAETDN